MVRYVHHELAAVVEVGVAMAVTAPVVFGVRGLPQADSGEVFLALYLAGVSALFGLLAVSTRPWWLGGEKRDLESAVPLTDPKAVLSAPRESMRRSFHGSFIVTVGLPTLAFGLLWDPWGAAWGIVFIPERLVKGVYVSFWERRHGVLLWRGRVEEQPLGKGQFLYSSPRQTTPG
ncbi:hypothetical protein [Streptomyces phaeochromogenes]|uniref:hypothetical protein n=1 Tax=Streptomyces phaeochromogenes TaxID=1923 RepID=UPI0033C7D3B9